MASKISLDASAFLAVANREPGSQLIYPRLKESVMSVVTAVEVIEKLVLKGMSHKKADEYLQQFVHEIAEFDYRQALLVAAMAPTTSPLGLSFGDRACLALASVRGISVLTVDQAWMKIDLGIRIEVIRPVTNQV